MSGEPRTIKKLRSRLTSPQQKLIFEISLCTGERMGTIVQLKVFDVYDHQGKVLNTITFGKTTRHDLEGYGDRLK